MKSNREFFETSVKPRLIQMAIDGGLSEMNDLFYEMFEDDEQDDSEILTRLGTLVSEDVNAEEQLANLRDYIAPENRANSDLSQLADFIGMEMTENAEFIYTVKGLCDAIGLNIEPATEPSSTHI